MPTFAEATSEHEARFGWRNRRWHVSTTAGATGLLMVLHGATHTPKIIWDHSKADQIGAVTRCLVCYPAGIGRWWKIGGATDWFNRDFSFLGQLCERLIVEYGLRRDRVFLAGHSRGGQCAAELAVRGDAYLPFRLAGLIVYAGRVGRVPRDLAYPKFPVLSLVNDEDFPFNGKAQLDLEEKFNRAGHRVENRGTLEMGFLDHLKGHNWDATRANPIITDFIRSAA